MDINLNYMLFRKRKLDSGSNTIQSNDLENNKSVISSGIDFFRHKISKALNIGKRASLVGSLFLMSSTGCIDSSINEENDIQSESIASSESPETSTLMFSVDIPENSVYITMQEKYINLEVKVALYDSFEAAKKGVDETEISIYPVISEDSGIVCFPFEQQLEGSSIVVSLGKTLEDGSFESIEQIVGEIEPEKTSQYKDNKGELLD